MDPIDIWTSIDMKLIAILRGIRPEETVDVVTALLNSGIRAIEIPMNSPDVLTSIELAVNCARDIAPGATLVGAGTVLAPTEVDDIEARGGNLIVSPNVNPAVVRRTVERGLLSLPGVFTATEAHLAVSLGATALKFFPASELGPSGIKAIAATLPKGTELCAVGGVEPGDIAAYHNVGVSGFGLGSSLYKEGSTVADVATSAEKFVTAFTA